MFLDHPSRIYFTKFQFWAAPHFHFSLLKLWGKSVHHQQTDIVCMLASLSILHFVTLWVWTRCILQICLALLYIMELGHSLGYLPLRKLSIIFCCFCMLDNMTNKLEWNNIVLWGLNIRGHLPCAVKEALADAAAFSRTSWIKPKSWGALPICLAFPPIITAQKNTTLHKMINSANQII